MTKSIRYFYRQEDKLKGSKVFELLFSEGKSFSNFPFRVVWIRNKESVLKAGFVVGTKYFKSAVQRNKIKRLMREAYRLQKNALQDHVVAGNSGLSVVILYTANEIPPYETVYEKMKTILNRLIKLTDENDQVHT